MAAVTAAALICVPPALADTSESANWAGYAVHRAGASFTKVIGTWTQPHATCTSGQPTYSSAWVGIGGYSASSQALEQIGTEADCTAAGRAVSSAWYELVPAASSAIKLTVNAGDRVRAGVSVTGQKVTVSLDDLTRHRSFTKTLHAAAVDTGSAEWILEAPSVCQGQSTCQTLPLADFGSTGFSSARATTTAGHTGAIQDRRWTTTKISLAEGGHRFVGGAVASTATAVPSSLSAKGSAFTVTYRGSSSGSASVQSARVTADRLFHPAPAPSAHLSADPVHSDRSTHP
jgi:hypothetical protein